LCLFEHFRVVPLGLFVREGNKAHLRFRLRGFELNVPAKIIIQEDLHDPDFGTAEVVWQVGQVPPLMALVERSAQEGRWWECAFVGFQRLSYARLEGDRSRGVRDAAAGFAEIK
jgi:hypothetical protein